MGNAAAAPAVLKLSPQQQQLSGLRTAALEAIEVRAETLAYGKVIDILPLLELRARYRAMQADLAVAEAALRVAEKSRERLARLHRESIVATRELIQVEAQLAAERARTQAAQGRLREIREAALQSWGNELFRQTVASESELFQKLLNRQQVLLLLSLPADRSLPEHAGSAIIAPAGNRQLALEAKLISPAPRTDEASQGETWFFLAPAQKLRTGMRLDAWISQAGETIRGVAIPAAAVVWHQGQPWVFLKTDGAFQRRPLGGSRGHGKDWFAAEGFAPGEQVVVVGSQMLLAEELRRRIPAENDD